jgi:hypothetical protein
MKRALRIALSLLVSAGFIAWTFHGKDIGGAIDALRGADIRWLIPYMAILAGIQLCRTLRWEELMRPQLRMGFWEVNRLSAIGLMALVVLPLRLGELARPMLVAGPGEKRTTFTRAFAPIVVERVVDGLLIALLLFTVLMNVAPQSAEQARAVSVARASGYLVGGIFGAALLAVVLAEVRFPLVQSLVRGTAGRIAPRLAERILGLLGSFVEGVRLARGRPIAVFLVYTVTYWTLNGISMVVLARMFGIAMTVPQGFAVLAVLVIAIMIPAGPGMVGTFQAGVLFALLLVSPGQASSGAALAYANAMWLLQTGWQVLLGLAFLAGGAEIRLPDLWARLQAARADPP